MTGHKQVPRHRPAWLAACVLAIAAMALAAAGGCGAEEQVTQPVADASGDTQSPVATAAEATTPPAGAGLVAVDAPQPVEHTAYFRAATDAPTTMPTVLLTKQHEALCQVGVGDTLPPIELTQLGGRRIKLSDLYGKTATVVVFWKGDRRMARAELADLGPDVIGPFADQGVAVVGIAVREPARAAQAALREAKATFPNLLDPDGQAFAKVGSEKLPRTYVLDPQGKVLWFDIEYSLATRRELNQALRSIVGSSE